MDRKHGSLAHFQRLNSSSSSAADEDYSTDFASFCDMLDIPPHFSPSHPAFLSPGPTSSSSSFSLHCGALQPTGWRPGRVRERALLLQQADSLRRGHRTWRGPQRGCLVCGDLASGFHYGVASCEACKAFFKRTIQGNMEYSCLAGDACEVTRRRRKACQACQKCLQAGMLREGVRIDRVRGGRQTYGRRAEPWLANQDPPCHPASSGHALVSHLLLTEPAPLAASQEGSTNEGGLLSLCELLNRQLLLLIGWAKEIPGFSDLSLVDQISLLQGGWMEALLVAVAWRSQRSGGAELVFAENLRLSASQCGAAGLAELQGALRLLSLRFQLLQLSAEEAVMLKAVALGNADADPLDCPDSVQRFRDGLHRALQEHERSRGEERRAGRLLMSLPLLRQAAELAVHHLLQLHRRRCVPLHKLLLEMLEAQV